MHAIAMEVSDVYIVDIMLEISLFPVTTFIALLATTSAKSQVKYSYLVYNMFTLRIPLPSSCQRLIFLVILSVRVPIICVQIIHQSKSRR
jgi:hypothetical protein